MSARTADVFQEIAVNYGVHGDGPLTSIRRLELVCAKDVEPKEVTWLYEGFLPVGKLAVIDGPPGIGKTAVAIDLIARATRGARMPGADRPTPAQTVLIAGVEDGWDDTIRPRLDAAQADLTRVHFVTVANNGTFTVPDDVALLAEAIRETGAGWVHIDAIMGTLSETVRTNSDHDVRRALGSLKDMAESLGVLITFIRHPRKSGAAQAIDAGGGSTAFVAVARIGLFAALDPTDDTEDLNARRRVLAVAKSNLGRIPPSRSFQLINAPNGRPCVAWGPISPVTADELASAPMRFRTPGTGTGEAATKKASAAQWLETALANGVRRTPEELMGLARHSQISWRTVQRAAGEIGVIRTRGKVKEPSVWHLPAVPPTVPPNLPTYGTDGTTVEDRDFITFAVAPSVAPLGTTGATDEIDPAPSALHPVAPTSPVSEKLGATGATGDDAPLFAPLRQPPDALDDDG